MASKEASLCCQNMIYLNKHKVYFELRLQVSVIDGSSPFASTYDLANIITLYQQRNCKVMNLC